MMWTRTGDALSDFDSYSAEQEAELQKLPKCCECGEPIQSDICFEFDLGLICPDCLSRNHRKLVDDYI